MKQMPETERPYEKLEQYGEKALSNAELLAIIIKTPTVNIETKYVWIFSLLKTRNIILPPSK